MIKKYFNNYKYLLATLFIVLIFAVPAKAATHNIANALEVSFDGDSVFHDSNMYPGKEIYKNVKVKNYGIYPHTFSIATSGVSGGLANVIYITPKINNTAIWNKNLSSIATNPITDNIIANINPGETIDVVFYANMSSSLGNEYMNQGISAFKFYMGNESSDQVEPSQDNNNGNSNLESNQSSSFFDSVAVNFFGTQDSTGQTEGVVDTKTQDNKDKKSKTTNIEKDFQNNDNVKGAQTGKCYAWLLLLLLLIFLIIYKTNSKKIFLDWLWPILAGIIIFIAHRYIDDLQTQTFLCKYFLWIDIVILIIYYFISSIFSDKD